MKIKYLSILLCISFLLAGCGKKEVVGTEKVLAQSRLVTAFSSVNISGYYNVNITIGKPQSVVIKVNGNLLPYIKTEVKSKTLKIETKKGYLLRPQGIPEVDIVIPALSKLALSGNNIATVNNYRGDDLEVCSNGSNQVTGQGLADTVEFKLSGNTNIDTQKLFARKVTIDSTGNSKIFVYARDHLNITISGNGVVNYSGSPKIKQEIHGSGAITKIDETVNK